jgi:hypothetical protein
MMMCVVGVWGMVEVCVDVKSEEQKVGKDSDMILRCEL